MSHPPDMLTIEINHRSLRVPRGLTILQAAQQHDIYIPTLCAHADLTPHGGCRLCLVEVDGLRGLPTACTTPVTDGMVVRTTTAQLQAERSEILQLILSEHTSSCLICEENEACREFMGTIRKVGITTSCRTCANDGQCELQTVCEWIGIQELKYPVRYRTLAVEKEDPFFDRDYNLCILCGRCVRVCQDVRLSGTLAFLNRGPETAIGPAFGRTHIEANCEFCGACVAVCPTGALADKTRKWEGKPDHEEVSVCPLCSLGCSLRLLLRGERVVGALPVSGAQLCVKGRYAVSELVGGHGRLAKPSRLMDGQQIPVSWDEAEGLLAEKLAACPPERFGLLIAPDLTCEDMYVAQKFARGAMRSPNLDCTARTFYGASLNSYVKLLHHAAPLDELQRADVVLCVGFDPRYGASAAGVEIKRAAAHARLVTIHAANHGLTRFAHQWIRPEPGAEAALLRALDSLLSGSKPRSANALEDSAVRALAGELTELAEALRKATYVVIVAGPDTALRFGGSEILEAILALVVRLKARFLPILPHGNLVGSILMGTYPELTPGGRTVTSAGQWNADALGRGEPLQVLWVIGDPPDSARRASEFLIVQNVCAPAHSDAADVLLPASAFTETEGTLIAGDGRVLSLHKTGAAPRDALPDWQILCRVAKRMGAEGFDFDTVRNVQAEIAGSVERFRDLDKAQMTPTRLVCDVAFATRTIRSESRRDGFALTTVSSEHSYRGIPLTSRVPGLAALVPENTLIIHPEDAREIGLHDGQRARVTATDIDRVWPFRLRTDQPRGIVSIIEPGDLPPHSHIHPVKITPEHVQDR